MNIGMLWYDNDPRTGIESKIERAANYYHSKYGAKPTVCFVHPSMVKNGASEQSESKPLQSGGLQVRCTKSVMPNHFWIGVNGVVTPSES